MNFYGFLLAEKGAELDRAEELLRGALEREPENGYFLDSLGWIKFKQAQYENALEILRRATDVVGDDPVIWEHLGDTYRKLGRIEEAGEAYRRSLGIDPERDQVRDKAHEIEAETAPLEK
jgi:tetratricopeptide (TPR) repeat protein